MKLGITIVALVALIGSARADRAKAREQYVAGVAAYNLGDYAKARDLFKGAYEQHPDPLILFNLAQAERQLGDKQSAVTHYRSFLRETPSAGNADEVRRLIGSLEQDIGREREHKNEPPHGTLAAPGPPPPPSAAAQPEIAARPPWQRNPAGWAVLGVGIGLGAVGGGLLGGSSPDMNSARSAMTLPQQVDRQGHAQQLEVGGWIVLGIGVAAIVTGAVLLATHRAVPPRYASAGQ